MRKFSFNSATTQIVTLRSYKDARKAKNRVAKKSRRQNHKA